MLEEVFTVNVKVENAIGVESKYSAAVMLLFTGTVTGKYFQGYVLNGGVDTQLAGEDGKKSLSARYMLEGKDYTGENCRIFIENNGHFNDEKADSLFSGIPRIITNSKALDFLNTEAFNTEGMSTEEGVEIKVFRQIEK